MSNNDSNVLLDSPHHLEHDAMPLSRRVECRLVGRRLHQQQAVPLLEEGCTITEGDDMTLERLCRAVVADHLERYPPEAMGMLSEEDWESIVTCRHHRKAPKEGSGGLDGTGRVAPAISSKYLASVEQCNSHLAESEVVDDLVWKDCVNFKFKLNSPTRPLALAFPWPIVLQQMQLAGEQLETVRNQHADDNIPSSRYQEEEEEENDSDDWTVEEERLVTESIQIFRNTPMSVSLLKTTGVGKIVKKFIKAFSHSKASTSSERFVKELEQLLQSWMDMASRGGVAMNKGDNTSSSSCNKLDDDHSNSKDDEEDLKIAESCSTWRALFMALEDRESRRRASQGARMREKRRQLDSDRPKIVKVRPTRSKHDDILERAGMKKCRSGGITNMTAQAPSKIQQIRRETLLMANRKQGIPVAGQKSGGAFGAAVAFAFAKNNPKKRKATTSMDLAGGKRMNVPQRSHHVAAPAFSKSNLKKPPPTHRR